MKAFEPLRVAAPLLLLIGAGCPGEQAQQGRGEADRVAHAVRQLREAGNSAKRPLLESLSRLQTKHSDVRELQQTCVAAYRSHLEGFDKSEAVRRSLDTPDAQAAQRTSELMSELESAEDLLRVARQGTQRCTELEGKLRRAHKL